MLLQLVHRLATCRTYSRQGLCQLHSFLGLMFQFTGNTLSWVFTGVSDHWWYYPGLVFQVKMLRCMHTICFRQPSACCLLSSIPESCCLFGAQSVIRSAPQTALLSAELDHQQQLQGNKTWHTSIPNCTKSCQIIPNCTKSCQIIGL